MRHAMPRVKQQITASGQWLDRPGKKPAASGEVVRCRSKSAAWILLASIALVGCGASEGPGRVVVRGEVTYEGQPVSNGQIYFYPTENTQGPVSGGPIKDGRYVAKARGGVLVGSHRVEITAFRAPKAAAGFAVTEGTPPEQYLPARFNSHSELAAVVDGEEDPTTQDFHLTRQ